MFELKQFCPLFHQFFIFQNTEIVKRYWGV